MITKFKIFENTAYQDLHKTFQDATLYLESITPISTDDGFINCLYDYDNTSLLISFYFDLSTEDELLDIFFNFLDENKLEFYDHKIVNHTDHDNDRTLQADEITVKLSNEQVIEFSNYYDTLNKYNL